ncbi:MAG: BtpA/SgcQ family protein [Bacilli bacterium]
MSINKNSFPLALCMIQPEPFPGSFRNQGMSFQEVMDLSISEVEMISKMGFDGYIIQNRNDAPIQQVANAETIAYMSVLSYELRNRFPDLIQGILVDWDGVASLAVADATQADFIRIEHTYTGVEVGYAGLMQAQCVDICNMRKRINSKMLVYADVQEIHYEQLGGKKIADAAFDTIYNAFADGLFIGGSTLDESIQIYKDVRKRLGNDVPLFLSAGSTGDNIEEILEYYDGVSVGTWIKNGNMKNPIDPIKAKMFMDKVRNSRNKRNREN